MLSTNCIASQYDGTVQANPLACTDLGMPHYVPGSGDDGWRVDIGWIYKPIVACIEHPMILFVVLLVLLNLTKVLHDSATGRLHK